MDKILINKYRQQLMGVASIGVLLVHSNEVVIWPNIISIIFGYGGIGVYMFVFISAVGLYLSLSRQGEKNAKTEFYIHRFVRVMVPYILIAGTWYSLKYFIIEQNVAGFFYEISLLSYWLGHQGAWYVAMLIPIYLIFPWFYEWAEIRNRNKKIVTCLAILIILSLMIDYALPKLYKHISQVLCSYIVYFIGYYEAIKVKKGIFRGIKLSIICTLLLIVRTITPLRQIASVSSITWAMFGSVLVIVIARILNQMNCKPINKFLGFLGKYSLEMYLWNIFLLQMIQYFSIVDLLEPLGKLSEYVIYGIVLGCGIILSVIYGKLARMISKRFV